MALWHIMDSDAGCAFAVKHGLAAVVVDALRASATAAMLLHHGAERITVVRDVADALAAKGADPEALLLASAAGCRLRALTRATVRGRRASQGGNG